MSIIITEEQYQEAVEELEKTAIKMRNLQKRIADYELEQKKKVAKTRTVNDVCYNEETYGFRKAKGWYVMVSGREEAEAFIQDNETYYTVNGFSISVRRPFDTLQEAKKAVINALIKKNIISK